MPPADARRWKAARSLPGLGELTALWLEGAIGSQPAYEPGHGPDPETASLIPALAALNRAGYLTTCSQPGGAGLAWRGGRWEQRAAVDGFAGAATARALAAAADSAGLVAILGDPAARPRWRVSYQAATAVTRCDGEPCTWVGAQVSRRHLRSTWVGYGICHRAAVNAVCRAWQVTVIDPEWGRPDALWTALAAVTAAAGGAA